MPTMTDETIATRNFERVIADGQVVIATAKLERIGGNARPHFALTGEVWRSQHALSRNRTTGSEEGLEISGAIHDEILKAFPELGNIERLHLADDTGAPMHAVKNGWYWYSDYDGRGTNLYPHQEPMFSMTPHQRGAHYLRVDPSELPEGMDKEAFTAFVETLRSRWQDEADTGLEFLKS